jgi:hypothetical protein
VVRAGSASESTRLDVVGSCSTCSTGQAKGTSTSTWMALANGAKKQGCEVERRSFDVCNILACSS